MASFCGCLRDPGRWFCRRKDHQRIEMTKTKMQAHLKMAIPLLKNKMGPLPQMVELYGEAVGLPDNQKMSFNAWVDEKNNINFTNIMITEDRGFQQPKIIYPSDGSQNPPEIRPRSKGRSLN